MVINKKLLRGSRSVKMRLLGCMLMISLSAAILVSFTTAMRSVKAWLDDFRDECVIHDIRVTTVLPVTDIPDARFEARYFTEAEPETGKLLRISSETHDIDRIRISSGRALSSDGDMLIDSLYAGSNGISIGDRLIVGGREFTICGFYVSPDTILPAKTAESIMVSSDSFGLAAVSEKDLRTFEGYKTEYLIKLNDCTNDNMNNVLAEIHDKYIVTGYKKAAEDNRATYIDGDIKLFSEDFQILPFIFIVIASFSGAAVTARIMKAENVQMGILYAFGYKRSALYFHYMLYPLIIWAVGVITGCTGGILMTPAIAEIQKTRYLFTGISTALDPEALIKAALIPLISLFVICSAGVLTALMKRPLELIRGEKKQSKHTIISALSLNGLRFRPRFTIRLFLRNIFRELFLTFGIAISAVLLLTFVSMITSFGSVLSLSFDRILDYELMYTLKAPQTDDLGSNCYINNISVLLDGDYVSFNGVRDDISAMKYDDADGKAMELSSLHVITVNMAEKYGIREGDTVTLTNSMNGDKYDIRIDKICMSYVENFISVPLDEFNRLTGQPDGSYIIVASRNDLGIAEDRISTVATKEADRKAVSETILPLNILLSIIFIFASLTAFILIITVSSVIIEENHYTITLMKAFGYTDRLVSSLVIDINAAAAGIGYLIGIPLTLQLSDKVFGFMSDTLGMYIPANLDPIICVAGGLFTMLLFFAVKLISQRRIFAASPAEALKARE